LERRVRISRIKLDHFGRFSDLEITGIPDGGLTGKSVLTVFSDASP
jgi:hypothetical protein